MPTVADIKFKNSGKTYFFDPNGYELNEKDIVIVETAKGVEYGTVVAALHEVSDKEVQSPLKPVLRKATAKDLDTIERNKQAAPEAFKIADEKIAHRKLDMKLIEAEYAFDGSKIVFYFTADGRVDFRQLVKDLASHFKMRIELRQIGIRDECKMLGGVAPCGRVCCCSNHLPDFEHVTIKMAKNQGFPINPAKISGLCGRLMCCLKYENDHYVQTGKRMPKINSEVKTPDGPGIVLSNNILREKVRVKVQGKKDSFEIKEYLLSEIKTKQTMADEMEDDKDERIDGLSD